MKPYDTPSLFPSPAGRGRVRDRVPKTRKNKEIQVRSKNIIGILYFKKSLKILFRVAHSLIYCKYVYYIPNFRS